MIRFDFTDGFATLEPRPRYLHVIEHGFVGTAANMAAYCAAIGAAAAQHTLAHVLVDTRDTQLPDPGDPKWKTIRILRWQRIRRSSLTFAFVVADDVAAARVSMTARGVGVNARGFAEPAGALAWLLTQ